jgi:hypothetical protein
MSKVTVRENFRIEITFDEAYGMGCQTVSEEDAKSFLEDIKSQIERHVDGCGGRYGPVSLLWDTTDRCAFCESEWECEPSGQPMCCEEAQEEWLAGRTACPDCAGDGQHSHGLPVAPYQCETCDGAGVIAEKK